ncbi:hypothetical protein CHS0354_004883 [Potamilus streckersoni]|uniref:Uncharacterized protein n=1 Tax=Potamilus streckersoni TaxID=2493646 RepID=A0AAE0VZW5_9BIVA|nr:hypothetical protein CHS0354_004883 [Potamilus streckersoni]
MKIDTNSIYKTLCATLNQYKTLYPTLNQYKTLYPTLNQYKTLYPTLFQYKTIFPNTVSKSLRLIKRYVIKCTKHIIPENCIVPEEMVSSPNLLRRIASLMNWIGRTKYTGVDDR